MSIHQNRPIDHEDAEQILRGDPAARAGRSRLDGVLAAAAAAAGAWETAGEDAAAAAFAAAHLASPPQRRRTSMLKSGVAKILTVKVAAACLAIGGAGVALAAGTGVLPSPLPKPPAQHSVDPSPSAHPRPSGRPSRHPGLPAELLKLCQRYAADPDGARLGDLGRPEFGKLVEGAGGKDRDRVDHFCADVLESDPSGTPGDYPDDPDGFDGSDGFDGADSSDGPDGHDGLDGHDGPDGHDDPDGAS